MAPFLRLVIVSVFCAAILVPTDQAGAAGDDDPLTLRLPLEGGRIMLGTALERIGDELGVVLPGGVERLDFSIDARSLAGRLQLRALERLTGGVLSARIERDEVVFCVDRAALANQLARIGPDQPAAPVDTAASARHGIGFARGGEYGRWTPMREMPELPPRVIVLVHGLDDPGYMWRDLVPALQAEGYAVARFEYPNDGPIAEAADLLATNLRELRRRGVLDVDVIAHSMGGLVARDLLTRPAYYNGDGAAAGSVADTAGAGTTEVGGRGNELPALDRLIMVGTPNHGSQLARLHMLAELREHAYRAWQGGAASGAPPATADTAERMASDGRGEGAIDLLPNSLFLQRLNQRPMPAHTRMTIIAGRISPIDGKDAQGAIEGARGMADSPRAPQWLREFAGSGPERVASTLLGAALDNLGDGCVSLESAALAGVDDFTIVRGNHVTILVNVGSTERGPQRVPPAIPIIIDRLRSDQPSE